MQRADGSEPGQRTLEIGGHRRVEAAGIKLMNGTSLAAMGKATPGEPVAMPKICRFLSTWQKQRFMLLPQEHTVMVRQTSNGDRFSCFRWWAWVQRIRHGLGSIGWMMISQAASCQKGGVEVKSP